MGFVYGAMCPMGDTPGCDALWCVRATRWVARYDGNNMTFRSRKNTRLRGYDYAQAGCYFVTVCVKDHACVLGEIRDGQVCLNDHGKIVEKCWHNLPDHYDVKLDAFVVMPNHIHGILILDGNNMDLNDNDDNNGNGINNGNPPVETPHAVSLQSPKSLQSTICPQNPQSPQQPTHETIGHQRFQNQGKNTVSSILGSYKSAISKHAHRLGLTMDWQFRFYDHVIRDDAEYARIAQYIETNVDNWATDKFFDPEE